MPSVVTTPNLDDLLLDVATAIELSGRDRRFAESRYRLLKNHVERAESPLAPYLNDSESRIYPQGSISIGTTIVSGTEDDRFDLDALVELRVPPERTPKHVLDLLWETLKDFPNASEVVRCTRCVQIRFAFMHMDVAVLDRKPAIQIERAGEIFHSPDKGESYRVPANPFGFSLWFRKNVHAGGAQFTETLIKRRSTNGIDRLPAIMEFRGAEQDDLPPVLPPLLDSEQVVALKLLKRYINLRYEDRDLKKPPSVYLSKLAVDAENSFYGLCAQLEAQAQHVAAKMRGQFPDERNPSYRPDRLNDRWPKNKKDMVVLEEDMNYLIAELKRAKTAEFSDIATIVSGIFGERIAKRSVQYLLDRAEAAGAKHGSQYEKGTGAVVLKDAVVAPAIARNVSAAPAHNFHSEEFKKDV